MSFSSMNSYMQAILVSLISFPFVAAMLTLPFTVRNYRRFGGISILRTVIFYSFVLYMMCAFLLTVLPLPARHDVAAREAVKVCFIPCRNLYEGLCDFGFDPQHIVTLLSLSLWRRYLVSNQFFQIFANCIMLLPLGVYLRYFFRCDLKKTVLISFLVSFFYEFTQFTGLFFIYPHAYRCPDINDLITNTFGGYLGYVITPLLTHFLPTRDELDELSRKSGEHVTLFRELIAAAIDLTITGFVIPAIAAFAETAVSETVSLNLGIRYMPLCFILYFSVLQYLCKGQTIGKMLVRIRAVRADGTGAPKLKSYFIRYFYIYFVYPFLVFFDLTAICGTAVFFVGDFGAGLRTLGIAGTVFMLAVTLMFILKPLRKARKLPHDYYSGIAIVPVPSGTEIAAV